MSSILPELVIPADQVVPDISVPEQKPVVKFNGMKITLSETEITYIQLSLADTTSTDDSTSELARVHNDQIIEAFSKINTALVKMNIKPIVLCMDAPPSGGANS
ncbi:hypothetical protein [Endozoicomonas sp.]|uniref:hypothetical protein n=1 Tax=Endozoicomonas sp. TaxID=1892382 RepID=UPI0028835A40|nr:hypothetical protein [Endozoicomonas sp.]